MDKGDNAIFLTLNSGKIVTFAKHLDSGIFCTSDDRRERCQKESSYLSRLMTKPTKWHVRPAKTQISLAIRPVRSESSLCAYWIAKGPSFLHADSENPDQTGRMPRLIRIFAGRTCHFVGFVMRRIILSVTDLFAHKKRL